MTSINKDTDFQSTNSTVFIVDDQSTSRIIMESIAKTIGNNVNVKCFDNATDALIGAESSTPDLILTDYKMPGIDGVEFIKRLRNNDNCRDIPIVIISAHDDDHQIKKAQEIGVSTYVKKPFTLQQLKEAIEKAISEK
jgi:two-component system response regulator RpfG